MSGTSTAPADGTPGAAPGPASGSSVTETTFYEGGPAKGDLLLNLLFGLTLIGLPFAVGAIVRALWLRYRITSRRIEVNGGWLGRDRTQVVYSQIREVRSVPRGFGAWGDMVLVLDDGFKLEMRSVPRFRELETYIEQQRSQRRSGKAGSPPTNGFGSSDKSAA
ncbi:MAG: PH domain-containing protein [Cyanobacteriota bacterium]|nr:PH domain-containing protein [Cyanobacteriota bacterium]